MVIGLLKFSIFSWADFSNLLLLGNHPFPWGFQFVITEFHIIVSHNYFYLPCICSYIGMSAFSLLILSNFTLSLTEASFCIIGLTRVFSILLAISKNKLLHLQYSFHYLNFFFYFIKFHSYLYEFPFLVSFVVFLPNFLRQVLNMMFCLVFPPSNEGISGCVFLNC